MACNKCGNSNCNCQQDCSSNNCSELCTAVYVQNSFNIPACGFTALVDIPKLKTIIIGAYLWNPTYGYFKITSFNALTGQVLLSNECLTGNAIPGTIVPACTQFAVTPPPGVSLDIGGWSSVAGSTLWIYSSASTVTVPSDATMLYQKGDKVRLVQGGVTKYFYVTNVLNSTTIEITGGSDYTLTNAAIVNPAISREDRPYGFPDTFNWTPVFTGFAVDPGSVVARFSVKGILCFLSVRMGLGGTSNNTNFYVSLPITARTITNEVWTNSCSNGTDNGIPVAPVVYIASGSTFLEFRKDYAGALWTAANSKRADAEIFYEI